MLKIALGLHNLSTVSDKVKRTGIQEVVFQVLKAMIHYQGNDIKFQPVFYIPYYNHANADHFHASHVNLWPKTLENSLEEAGISLSDFLARWPDAAPFFAKHASHKALDRIFFKTVSDCDLYLETALVDVRNVLGVLKKLNPKILFGQILYDAGPLLYPEYADDGMHRWFAAQYIRCIREQDFTFSISRNSALEFADLLPRFGHGTRHQYYVPLPNYANSLQITPEEKNRFVEKMGIQSHHHIILSVATLEPRKNLITLIHAFERYMRLFPEEGKQARLILVGGKGWKNEELIAVLEKFPQQIVVPGYLSEKELQILFEVSHTLVMISHYEGYGLPIARAKASGMNVITCTNSSLPEAAQMHSLFVDPWNKDALACAIAQMDRKKQKKQSLNSIHYQQLESWTALFESYVTFMKTVYKDRVEDKVTKNSYNLLPPRKNRSIAIDVHNISIHEKEVRKTGIQEVVTNIFDAIPIAQKKLGNHVKLVPIPVVLPKHLRFSFTPTLTPTWGQFKKLCKESGRDIYSLGPTFANMLSGDSRALETAVSEAEWFVSSSQFCVERMPHFQRILNSGTKFCYLFYDNIPIKFPECAPQEINHWYRAHYLDSIKKWSSACIAISRHSACDLAEALGDDYKNDIKWLHFPYKAYPLPTSNHTRTLQKILNFGFKPPRYFVVLGSIDPRKNVSKILSAFVKFTSLINSEEDVSLVLIGASGWKHNLLLSQLDILSQEGRVIRPGYLSDEEMAIVLKHSCGLLMPSRYEGFGLPIAAACRFGIPVMTCVNSSLPEVAIRGDVLFVDPNSIDEMALALLRMFNETNLKQKEFNRQSYEWSDYVCDLAENLLSIGNRTHG